MLWPLWLSVDSEVASAAELRFRAGGGSGGFGSGILLSFPDCLRENMIQINGSASTTMAPMAQYREFCS